MHEITLGKDIPSPNKLLVSVDNNSNYILQTTNKLLSRQVYRPLTFNKYVLASIIRMKQSIEILLWTRQPFWILVEGKTNESEITIRKQRARNDNRGLLWLRYLEKVPWGSDIYAKDEEETALGSSGERVFQVQRRRWAWVQEQKRAGRGPRRQAGGEAGVAVAVQWKRMYCSRILNKKATWSDLHFNKNNSCRCVENGLKRVRGA